MNAALSQVQEANIARVRKGFDHVTRSGLGGLLEVWEDIYTKDFEFRPSLVGGLEQRVYRGRDGWEQYISDVNEAFEEWEFTDLRYEAFGDFTVLAAARVRTTGRASSAPVDFDAGYVFELRDGRVWRTRTFTSVDEAREEAHRAAA
jgi:ketosteroid isomerase-like protein